MPALNDNVYTSPFDTMPTGCCSQLYILRYQNGKRTNLLFPFLQKREENETRKEIYNYYVYGFDIP